MTTTRQRGWYRTIDLPPEVGDVVIGYWPTSDYAMESARLVKRRRYDWILIDGTQFVAPTWWIRLPHDTA